MTKHYKVFTVQVSSWAITPRISLSTNSVMAYSLAKSKDADNAIF